MGQTLCEWWVEAFYSIILDKSSYPIDMTMISFQFFSNDFMNKGDRSLFMKRGTKTYLVKIIFTLERKEIYEYMWIIKHFQLTLGWGTENNIGYLYFNSKIKFLLHYVLFHVNEKPPILCAHQFFSSTFNLPKFKIMSKC